MSAIHMRQIKAFLSSTFNGLIDLKDYANKPKPEQESAFLSRAIAADVLRITTNTFR